MTLLQIIINALRDSLTRHGGNKTRAAKELGVTVKTIRNYVVRYDDLKEFRMTKSQLDYLKKAYDIRHQ